MRAGAYAFSPADFLRYLRQSQGLRPAELRLPKGLILVFGAESWEGIRRRIRGRRTSWNRWVAVGRYRGHPVAIARSTIGAPAAATVLEESVALGTGEVLVFGACGSLSEELRIATLMIPTFAVPDEGTSVHYGHPARPAPSGILVRTLRATCRRLGLSFVEGGAWTTDAPYREPIKKARRLAQRGVIAVEMESSALFAVAAVRHIRVASLLVVSDVLGENGWNPGFYHPEFRARTHEAWNVLLDSISRRSP